MRQVVFRLMIAVIPVAFVLQVVATVTAMALLVKVALVVMEESLSPPPPQALFPVVPTALVIPVVLVVPVVMVMIVVLLIRQPLPPILYSTCVVQSSNE
jgi:hypothetical protein